MVEETVWISLEKIEETKMLDDLRMFRESGLLQAVAFDKIEKSYGRFPFIVYDVLPLIRRLHLEQMPDKERMV